MTTLKTEDAKLAPSVKARNSSSSPGSEGLEAVFSTNNHPETVRGPKMLLCAAA
jgi:hypothetical protein